MKKIMFHGPILSQAGMKPLYNARKPSLRTVWMPQSRLPLYICIWLIDGLGDVVVFICIWFVLTKFFWFINLVCWKRWTKWVLEFHIMKRVWSPNFGLTLITSMGVEATALPRLAMKLDLEVENRYCYDYKKFNSEHPVKWNDNDIVY